MIPRLCLLVLVGLCAALPAGTAYADDPATRASKRHFERGEKLFALGKFDEALEQYQAAFDAKPVPGLLFNIGQCYRNLGDYQQAIFSFKKYLKLEPEAPDREEVERLIEELEEKKARGDGERFTRRPPAEKKPVYKTWWFWTGAAVVGIAGGVGIYAATRNGPPAADFGPIVFGK